MQHPAFDQYKVTRGYGPKRSVCIWLADNGLGDHIHSMPAVYQKVRHGYDVTVMVNEWYRGCFEPLGATVEHVDQDEVRMGWTDRNRHRFDFMYSVKQWCFGTTPLEGPLLTRFEQFAQSIDGSLPETFSWIQHLTPVDLYKNAPESLRPIVLAPYAESLHRSYMWAHTLKQRMAEHLDAPIVQLGPVKWRDYVPTFQDLVNVIYSSRLVVTVDTGALALALAMKKPVVAVFGPTDERTYALQFSKYHPILLRRLRAESGHAFACHCKLDPAHQDRCTLYARCMTDILPIEIVNACEQMMKEVPV